MALAGRRGPLCEQEVGWVEGTEGPWGLLSTPLTLLQTLSYLPVKQAAEYLEYIHTLYCRCLSANLVAQY